MAENNYEELIQILETGSDEEVLSCRKELMDALYRFTAAKKPKEKRKHYQPLKNKFGSYSFYIDDCEDHFHLKADFHLILEEGISKDEVWKKDFEERPKPKAVTAEFYSRLRQLAFENLSSLTVHNVRRLVTASRDPEILMSVLHIKPNLEEAVQIALAEHDSLPEEGIEVLSRSPCRSVRIKIAKRPDTPIGVLENLSKDAEARVRKCVARRKNLNDKIYRRLAKDSSAEVRSSVAFNSSTPVDILKDLAKDPDRYVRKEVVENYSINDEIKAILEADSSQMIQRYIQVKKDLAVGKAGGQFAKIDPDSPWYSVDNF